MSVAVHKITCFITRQGEKGRELLLFKHPYAGIQIPAGTANPGEPPELSARREAMEETGLEDLALVSLLGEQEEPVLPGQRLIALPSQVYSRPMPGSFDWVHLPIGTPVSILRNEAGFTQVRYEEPDHFPSPEYTTYQIIGWVPDEALTDQRIRHFYLFEAHGATPRKWSVATDNHTFKLFWATFSKLPDIVPPQNEWLKWLKVLRQ
jgi:8-oxo-dGTP pyrophosphatase MutT (NUDIX family)